MPKKRYLVAHWKNDGEHSRENPNYYFGPMNYFVNSLNDADPNRCYTRLDMALKECSKACTRYWWADVAEVKEGA